MDSIEEYLPILRLDNSIQEYNEFIAWGLHCWTHPYGPVTVLPPVFNTDVGLPNIMQVDDSPALGQQPVHNTCISRMECPALTYITLARLEADTKRCLASLTDEDMIQYPSLVPIPDETTEDKDKEGQGFSSKTGAKKDTPKKGTPSKKNTIEQDELDSEISTDMSSSYSCDTEDERAIEDMDGEIKSGSLGDSGLGLGSDGSMFKTISLLGPRQAIADMTKHHHGVDGKLGDDLIAISRGLNCTMELTALALFNKVKEGFSRTGISSQTCQQWW